MIQRYTDAVKNILYYIQTRAKTRGHVRPPSWIVGVDDEAVKLFSFLFFKQEINTGIECI